MRNDFALLDESGTLAAIIEVNGVGHYFHKDSMHNLCEAAIRDALKRIVCSRVGMRFIEIYPKDQASACSEMERVLSSIINGSNNDDLQTAA